MIVASPQGDRELRSLDALVAMELQAGGGRLTQGISVTQKDAFGLPAATAAIRVASNYVMKRRLAVYRGRGPAKTEVTSTWQARFFLGLPNPRESWPLILQGTEASLTARNNAIWLKVRDQATSRVREVHLIHPDYVHARNGDGRIEYSFQDPVTGRWSDWLDESWVVHFRNGAAMPGSVWAPSPFEMHRDAFGAAVSKLRFENAVYDKGMLTGLAVTFPKEVTPEQARKFRELQTDQHGGVSNAGSVRVFGGGATVANVGLSLADAEYIDSKMMSAREVGQILGVPATLLDSNTREQRPLSPEHEEDRWSRHWGTPRLVQIQETLRVDPDFFGANAITYPQFADEFVRGDVSTESARLIGEVQAGILLPDEARAEKGLGPLPPVPQGDDALEHPGMVPQITPVGGAPNPNIDNEPPDDANTAAGRARGTRGEA